jgi:hypothetical protein
LNQKEHLSIYLDSPEAAFAPPNLNPTANFKLSIVNQKNPEAGDFFKGEGLGHPDDSSSHNQQLMVLWLTGSLRHKFTGSVRQALQDVMQLVNCRARMQCTAAKWCSKGRLQASLWRCSATDV